MPAYNEAGQLQRSVATLISALERLGPTFEIVLVDDGSLDATGEIVDSISRQDERVRAVHHSSNLGVGASIATAIGHSRGQFFILIPADLALEPQAIGRYLAAAPDADIVAGYTGPRSDYTLYRSLVSWANGALLRLLFRLPIRNFNYIHLYRSSLLRGIRLQYTHSAMLYAEIFVKAKHRGARIVQIPIPYVPRETGVATGAKPSLILKTGRDMIRLWFRQVTGRLSG